MMKQPHCGRRGSSNPAGVGVTPSPQRQPHENLATKIEILLPAVFQCCALWFLMLRLPPCWFPPGRPLLQRTGRTRQPVATAGIQMDKVRGALDSPLEVLCNVPDVLFPYALHAFGTSELILRVD